MNFRAAAVIHNYAYLKTTGIITDVELLLTKNGVKYDSKIIKIGSDDPFDSNL